MALNYLPEHAQATFRALNFSRNVASHLRYRQAALFALPIDLAWVERLSQKLALAEKVEAFVSYFGRLQDHLSEKLPLRLAALVGESSKTQLDTLAIAERVGWIASADAFIGARKLRTALVHEYMHDAQHFLESLLAAEQACEMFFGIVDIAQTLMTQLGLVSQAMAVKCHLARTNQA